MFNIIPLALGLGLFSGFPKPDLVCVDVGSVRIAAGYALGTDEAMLPSLGISFLESRF